jgi:hypothetical protein
MNLNEKNITDMYKKLLIERDGSFNNYRNNFLNDISKITDAYEIVAYIKNELLYHYKIKSEILLGFYKNTTAEQRTDDDNFNITLGIYDAILKFIEDQKEHYNKIIELEAKDNSKEKLKKLKWNSSPSIFGYLFLELANKGYIEFPLRNGELNATGLAKQLFELFEIKSTSETIISEFSAKKQSLSITKKQKFTIPYLSDLE